MRKYHTHYLSFSKPTGKNVFEYVFETKDEIGVTGKITGEIAKHNIDILRIHGSNDEETHRYILSVFCDFSKADTTAELFAQDVRKFPFVIEVDYAGASGTLFDSFRFPLKIIDNSRVIVMRVDPLLRVEKNLEEKMGSAGEVIMFDEGRIYARETMMEYRKILGDLPEEILMRSAIDGL